MHFLHAARKFADIELTHPAYFARFDYQAGERSCLTEQSQSRFLFELRQDIWLRIAVVHTAFEDFAFAGATGSVAAPIGQCETFAQGCGKHGFAIPARKGMVAGFDRYLMRHAVDSPGRKARPG